MTNNEQTTCADCGASFPQPPASGGASGYATTRVPRILFPRPARVRYVDKDTGASVGTRAHDEPAPCDGYAFPAVYNVEGYAEAARLEKLLGSTGRDGETRRDGEQLATPERRVCYACAGQLETESMVASGTGALYLTRNRVAGVPPLPVHGPGAQQSRNEPADWWKLQDWPGVASFRLLGSVRTSIGYGFGARYPVRTFRFVGPDGYVWSGRSAGNMDLARVRRTKERAPA